MLGYSRDNCRKLLGYDGTSKHLNKVFRKISLLPKTKIGPQGQKNKIFKIDIQIAYLVLLVAPSRLVLISTSYELNSSSYSHSKLARRRKSTFLPTELFLSTYRTFSGLSTAGFCTEVCGRFTRDYFKPRWTGKFQACKKLMAKM